MLHVAIELYLGLCLNQISNGIERQIKGFPILIRLLLHLIFTTCWFVQLISWLYLFILKLLKWGLYLLIFSLLRFKTYFGNYRKNKVFFCKWRNIKKKMLYLGPGNDSRRYTGGKESTVKNRQKLTCNFCIHGYCFRGFSAMSYGAPIMNLQNSLLKNAF